MASDADSRDMPSSAVPSGAYRSSAEEAPNLFAPISIENRITGTTRVRKQRVPEQLTPGSTYDYGRGDYFASLAAANKQIQPDAMLGYQKSVPPTFLHNTMPDWQDTQKPVFTNITPPPVVVYRQVAQSMRNETGAPQDPEAFSGGLRMGTSYNNTPSPPPSSKTEPPAIHEPSTRTRRAANGRGGYVPRHGDPNLETTKGIPDQADFAASLPPLPEPSPDNWELMGWKMPENAPLQNTAVWRASDLTMFERSAFSDPLDPFHNPADLGVEQAGMLPYPPLGKAQSEQIQGYAIPPYPTQHNLDTAPHPVYPGAEQPYYAAYPGDGQAGIPYTDAGKWQTGAYAPPPQTRDEPPAYYPEQDDRPMRVKAHKPTQTSKDNGATQRGDGGGLSTLGPWRATLLIGAALALLFCVIEVTKIVISLVQNEKDMKTTREQYYALVGEDMYSNASGVDLLPPGQTYVPTATPEAMQTATPTPRIEQNDPLIGVVDEGGATQTSFQPALPTPTPVVRTRLTKYPDNALLSIDETFAELRKENPDVVGRLTIEGVLDEVVAQRNNTFYLTHNARGVFGNLGALFVDEACVLTKPPENLLIRGQTTVENKLFQPLLRYATEGASFVQQHGILVCNTIYEQASYVVFAVIRADSRTDSPDYFNYAAYPTFQSDAQMLRYVDGARQRSLYDFNVDVRADDRLLTLATLTEGSDTSSVVLLCRMLRNGETGGNIQRN